jgi:hypothetical protein
MKHYNLSDYDRAIQAALTLHVPKTVEIGGLITRTGLLQIKNAAHPLPSEVVYHSSKISSPFPLLSVTKGGQALRPLGVSHQRPGKKKGLMRPILLEKPGYIPDSPSPLLTAVLTSPSSYLLIEVHFSPLFPLSGPWREKEKNRHGPTLGEKTRSATTA